jgi:hypothetical protein
MFRQVGPIVTIITAPGALGLSTCNIDNRLVERGSDAGPSPKIRIRS